MTRYGGAVNIEIEIEGTADIVSETYWARGMGREIRGVYLLRYEGGCYTRSVGVMTVWAAGEGWSEYEQHDLGYCSSSRVALRVYGPWARRTARESGDGCRLVFRHEAEALGTALDMLTASGLEVMRG